MTRVALKLDPITWDLPEGTDLALWSGEDDEPDLITQHVHQLLLAYKGEWAWDTDWGIDYLMMKGKGVSLESCAQMVRAKLLTIRGVVGVPSVEFARSWPEKKLTLSVVIMFRTGETALVTV